MGPAKNTGKPVDSMKLNFRAFTKIVMIIFPTVAGFWQDPIYVYIYI